MANDVQLDWATDNWTSYERYPVYSEHVEAFHETKWTLWKDFYTFTFSTGGWDRSVYKKGLESYYTEYMQGSEYTAKYVHKMHLTASADITMVSKPNIIQPCNIQTTDHWQTWSIKAAQAYSGAYIEGRWTVGSPYTFDLLCSIGSEEFTDTGVTWFERTSADIQVYANGQTWVNMGSRSEHVDSLFTAGYPIVFTIKKLGIDHIRIEKEYILFDTISPDEYNYMCSYETGYISAYSFQALNMSGTIHKECVGYPEGPVGDVVEYIWCGQACDELSSLRNANETGIVGRGGFLFDEALAYTYHMFTESLETAYYPFCKPDIDEFIQAINPDSPGYYSFCSLYATMESFLGNGRPAGQDLGMSFVSNTAQYNLTTLEDYYKLIGPKNMIDYGLAESAETYKYFKSTTSDDWDAESTEVEADVGNIFLGTSEILGAFGLSNSGLERTTIPTLITNDTEDTHQGMIWSQIDRNHFCCIFPYDNGDSTWDVQIKVYKFNFTTKVTSLEQTLTCFTEDNTDFQLNTCRFFYVDGHGSDDGRLYVGHPGYDDAKTDQGAIYVYDWVNSTSTFTYATLITKSLRNGYQGACVGYDGLNDLIVTTHTIDDFAAWSPAGVHQYTVTGSNSEGLCFSVGDGKVISSDMEVTTTWTAHLWTLGASSGSLTDTISATGTNYLAPANTHPIFYNGTWTGTRYPRLALLNTAYQNSMARVFQMSDASNIINEAFGTVKAISAVSWFSTPRMFSWLADNHYQRTSFPTFNGNAGSVFYADNLPNNYYQYYSFNAMMWDGSSTDTEYIVTMYLDDVDTDEWKYFATYVGDVLGTHVYIGNWWVSSEWNISNTDTIDSATLVMSASNATTDIYSTWFFNLDGTFYVAEGSGVFQSYGTIALAKAAAAEITLFSSQVPLIDIDGIDALTFYFCLEKQENWTFPTTTPTLAYTILEATPDALAEPIICMHFGSGERVNKVYKNTNDLLVAVAPIGADSEGLDMLVSGTFIRPLYDLSD